MKRGLITALVLSLILATGWGSATGIASARQNDSSPRVLSVSADGALLADDGKVWLPAFGGGASMKNLSLGAKEISGSTYRGIGVLPDGSLIGWTKVKVYGKIAEAADVKQVSGSHWLKPDGTVWTYGESTGKAEQVQALSDIAVFGFDGRKADLVNSSGEVLIMSEGAKPVVWGKVPNANDVAEIQAADSVLATLLRDGRVVIYNLGYFEMNDGPNYLKPIPVTVSSGAAHIALVDDRTLLIANKDGTASVNDPSASRNGKTETSELAGVRGIDRIVPAWSGYLFYARLNDGSWIAYTDGGKTESLSIPHPKELAANLETSKLQVGQTLKPSFVLKYDNGKNETVGGTEATVSVGKPHLLKLQGDGAWKALAVGETDVKIEAGGLSKTVTVSVSQSQTIQGGKTEGGATLLPMKAVFQALGGKIASGSTAKSYAITVGQTQIGLVTGSKTATVNGKKVTMKAAVSSAQGQTYFPADLLSSALGAKLQSNAKTHTLTIAFGRATMNVSTHQAGQKTAGGLYAVPGKGKYAGYQQLKGYADENKTAIYFKRNGSSLSYIEVDVRKIDLKRKVAWTDTYGNKHVNTVGEIRGFIAEFTNRYTSDWLLSTFGDVYIDYFPVDVPTDQLLDQYFRESGQL